MKKHFIVFSFILIGCIALLQVSCNNQTQPPPSSDTTKKEMSHADMVIHGKYLVTTIGCNDCHSPKLMTPQGPVPDSTKILSGHPASQSSLPIDKNVLKPGNWILFSPDLTMTVGPWGISYSANLTPDTVTGLGAWNQDVFIKTLRTGRHLGQDGGRAILPPMPWEEFSQLTDDDLKSIFTYLQSLPAISNKVPAPVSPPDVAKMK
jgi:mono/diheme cytochrome c family protein